MSKPNLCVDFDGVVHLYTSGWKGAHVIPDPPVPGALSWLWRASEHFDVQIYSSRTREPGGVSAMRLWLRKHASAELNNPTTKLWRETPGECLALFMAAISFPEQKPPAFLTIDDRAVRFDGDWADPALAPEALLAFRPWNKRDVPLRRAPTADELYAALQHGDDRHRQWLRDAIDVVYAGRPAPEPYP